MPLVVSARPYVNAGPKTRHVPEEIETIWRQEQQSKGFAVDGELSEPHWQAQLKAFASLNPRLRTLSIDEVLARQFV